MYVECSSMLEACAKNRSISDVIKTNEGMKKKYSEFALVDGNEKHAVDDGVKIP